ncbi:MAG: hypothetical protein Q8Q89_02165 [bacterium]|nr:hypothetical protein [bacterium]
MNKKQIFSVSSLVVVVALFAGLFVVSALANHSWGFYHWGRIANPFTLKLGDNVSFTWDKYLATSSNGWSQSSVLDTVVVSGKTSPKTCKPVAGRVEVCNNKYGRNGWLGVASIWINSAGHITQGAVKVNDSYFNSAPYNTSAWKNLVMCQEVGHTFGLDHQDENFNNPPLGSCMDYSSDPTLNQYPNQHDYDQLETIYSHLDSTNTVSLASLSKLGQLVRAGIGEANADENEEWGKSIRKSYDKRNSLYEKDLGKGEKVYTFVIWADPSHK